MFAEGRGSRLHRKKGRPALPQSVIGCPVKITKENWILPDRAARRLHFQKKQVMVHCAAPGRKKSGRNQKGRFCLLKMQDFI